MEETEGRKVPSEDFLDLGPTVGIHAADPHEGEKGPLGALGPAESTG